MILSIILILGAGIPAKAQEKDSSDFRIWYDFFFTNTLNSNFRILVQTNFKHRIESDWRQLLVRPTIIYTMRDEIYFQGGLSFFYTWENKDKIYEIRPWQGVNLFWPRIGQIFLNNFVRLEERFFAFDFEDENSMSLRARYAITTQIPINHNKLIDHTLYLLPYFETFFPMYEKGLHPDIERFRFSLGLGYKFNTHFRTELVYMHEKAKADVFNSYTDNRNTARIILRYAIDNGMKTTGL